MISHTSKNILLLLCLCILSTITTAQDAVDKIIDEDLIVQTDYNHEEIADSQDKFTRSQAWIFGLLASFIVSLLGFLMSGVMILILKSKCLTPSGLKFLIRVLISFAVGSLLSDAVVHIIPDVFATEDEGGQPKAVKPIAPISSLLILIGFGTFVAFERLLEKLGVPHSHGPDDAHNHAHDDHSNKHACSEQQVSSLQDDPEAAQIISKPEHTVASMANVEGYGRQSAEAAKNELILKSENEASGFDNIFSLKGRGMTGIMVLLADLIHNTMDGIGIGVTFASGDKTLALSTFIAILAHEIPKEISGMGILVDSNFPLKQAWFCNGVLNFSALIGAFIGLSLGTINEAVNAYVLAYVAGNFLYISLCSMLPIVTKEKRFKQSMGLLLAFIGGSGAMFALLALE